MPNDAAQFIESRQYQVEEVCRAFGVLPIMVGRSDKASTYASAEQMFLQHAVHTLGPWYACLEKSASRWLLSEAERRDGYYFKFNVNGLMRGAAKDWAEFYTRLYGVGALSPNDIRELEDMNPYVGGDEYRVPLNMAEPGQNPMEGDEDERLDCGLVELKAAPDAGADSMTFSGYGAVFGNMDAYGDVIANGAFTKTIADFKTSGVWPAMLSQHGGWDMSAESLTPIGVWTGDAEDEHGLYVEGRLADTPRGREMYALMNMQPRPAINGMSIGFRAIEWANRSKADEPRRTLKRVELVELSLVTFPANGKARVTGIKSDADGPSIRDAEKALRDAGFSRVQAKAILADGFRAMPLRDAEEGGVGELAALVRRNINTLRG